MVPMSHVDSQKAQFLVNFRVVEPGDITIHVMTTLANFIERTSLLSNEEDETWEAPQWANAQSAYGIYADSVP